MILNINSFISTMEGLKLNAILLLCPVLVLSNITSISQDNLLVLDKIIEHYGLKSIYLQISESLVKYSKNYVQNIRDMKSLVDLRIRTNWVTAIDPHVDSQLFMMVADNTKSILKISYFPYMIMIGESKLIVLVITKEVNVLYFARDVKYFNVLIIMDDKLFKVDMNKEFLLQEISSANDFISMDTYNRPDLYLPRIFINYNTGISQFPLIYNGGKTGLNIYYARTFEKYYAKITEESTTDENNIETFFLQTVDTYLYDGYPLTINQICFMLPVVDEILQEDFLKKPFQVGVWILALLFIIYFTIALRILVIRDLFVCFLESLAISVGTIYQGFNHKFVYIQMFVYGFILWNLHNAIVSSYLTTQDIGRNLKSFEDIQNYDIPLMGNLYVNADNPLEIIKIILPHIFHLQEIALKKGQFNASVKDHIFQKHLYGFDRTYGYLINDAIWSYFDYSQKFLKRKLFFFSKMCPMSGYNYPLRSSNGLFLLHDLYTLYTLRVLEGGLNIIWETISYRDIKFRFLQNEIRASWLKLGFKYFNIVWLIYIIGTFTSVCAFFSELLCDKYF